MRAPPEGGAVFAGNQLLGIGDAFGRREDMNLDLQFLVRRDGGKAFASYAARAMASRETHSASVSGNV